MILPVVNSAGTPTSSGAAQLPGIPVARWRGVDCGCGADRHCVIVSHESVAAAIASWGSYHRLIAGGSHGHEAREPRVRGSWRAAVLHRRLGCGQLPGRG